MNDLQARMLAAVVLLDRTEVERHFVLAVCGFETNYARGWVALARKLGAERPEDFANVHNWGAITAPPPGENQGPAFFMRDRWWRLYDTDAAGLRDAARTILKDNVREALARGNGRAAVFAMKANRYFEENPEDYVRNVAAKYDAIVSSGAPRLLSFTAPAGDSDLLFLLGVGGLAYWAWRRWLR